MNTISLVVSNTKGKSTNVEHEYLDFLIDGKSFDKYLPAEDQNRWVTHLGWDSTSNKNLVAIFTNEVRSELKEQRLLIYGCPVDQDPMCGAITAELEETDDEIIWKNFRFENQYMDPREDDKLKLPAFRFSKPDYVKMFQNTLAK